jgi:hypothetical protein
MLEAIREAQEFVKGKTRSSLDHDRMLVLSLVKEIEIIGEAASKISQEEVAEPHLLTTHRSVHARTIFSACNEPTCTCRLSSPPLSSQR